MFGQGDLRDLDEATLDAAASALPRAEIDGDLPPIGDLLVTSGLASSNSDARRTVSDGGAYVNNQRVADGSLPPAAEDLLHGRWLVLRRGKRNVALVELRRD